VIANLSIKTKIALAVAVLSTTASLTIGIVAYRNTAVELRRQVDRSLQEATRDLASRPALGALVGDTRRPTARQRIAAAANGPAGLDRPRGFEQILAQVVDGDGNVVYEPTSGQLPTTDEVLALTGESERGVQTWTTWTIDNESFRVLISSIGDSKGAVVVARSLAETNATLTQLGRRALGAALVVGALSIVIGIAIGGGVTRRLRRLSADISLIANDPTAELTYDPGGNDEVTLVANTFATTLTSLRQSQAAQQQLLQDAGHELRTPLTSLRANAEVLRRYDQLSQADREAAIQDLVDESTELSGLVDEIVGVLRVGPNDELVTVVNLGVVTERVVRRARRRSTAMEIQLTTDASLVHGRERGLERAISNLVDNAIKFGKIGDVIVVTVERGTVSVRDHGPGIDPADETRIFDRFYRSDRARAVTGSGLGLSIVAEVVRQHGGATFVRQPVDPPGAIVGFTLPVVVATGS
jgi:two-component system sensor histidine kinase MprB